MKTLSALSLILFTSATQAALVIDDFSGPGFDLCVNQPGCEIEVDQTLGSQVAGAWGSRDARIIVTSASDPINGDPDLPGSFTEAGGVASVALDAFGMPAAIDDEVFVDLFYDVTLGGQDLTVDGDAFVLEVLSSNLGSREAALTIDVFGTGGQSGTGTTSLSGAGTYVIPFSSLTGVVPEFAVLFAGLIAVTIDFREAVGASPISLAIDNLRVDDSAIVPLPAAFWLFLSALGLTSWLRRARLPRLEP